MGTKSLVTKGGFAPNEPNEYYLKAMNEITFSSITPIFNFELEHPNSQFSHFGDFKDARYSISLKKYRQGEAGFETLMKCADKDSESLDTYIRCEEEDSRKKLVSIHLSGYYHFTDYFLVINVTQPFTPERNLFGGGSPESICVTQVALDALRLHSLKGLFCYQTRWFRSPPHPAYPDAKSAILPPTNPFLLSHLGRGKSVLPDSEFTSCRSTIDSLLSRKGTASSTFDRVLDLALAYHRIVFNLEAIEHSFLILMVIFEALFKSESESNASQAAIRMSKLMSTVKSAQKPIQKEFFDNDPTCFCKLRNYIAHGNANLDRQIVVSKYPALYKHVTKAIIQLLAIPNGVIDNTRDYYTEITKYIDGRFSALPDS